MSFTHLQVRSGYTLMDSTITIEKLVEKASELGFTALALTDDHVLYGAIPFYKACKQYGVKPIIGMSVHVIDEEQIPEQIILFSKNNNGYQNLLKISTYIHLQQPNVLSKYELRQYPEVIIYILSF